MTKRQQFSVWKILDVIMTRKLTVTPSIATVEGRKQSVAFGAPGIVRVSSEHGTVDVTIDTDRFMANMMQEAARVVNTFVKIATPR